MACSGSKGTKCTAWLWAMVICAVHTHTLWRYNNSPSILHRPFQNKHLKTLKIKTKSGPRMMLVSFIDLLRLYHDKHRTVGVQFKVCKKKRVIANGARHPQNGSKKFIVAMIIWTPRWVWCYELYALGLQPFGFYRKGSIWKGLYMQGCKFSGNCLNSDFHEVQFPTLFIYF